VRLSKTKLMAGLQCPKRLYLSVYQPELAQVDAGLEARFAIGHEVGAVARLLYPEGHLIGHPENPGAAMRDTQAALCREGDALLPPGDEGLLALTLTKANPPLLTKADPASARGQVQSRCLNCCRLLGSALEDSGLDRRPLVANV
jgi:hypothetical protein